MKEIKGLRPVGQDEKPNAATVIVAKALEYLLSCGIFLGTTAMVAVIIMSAFGVMHGREPVVPALGFMFVWAGVWVFAVLVTYGNILMRLGDD